MLKHGKFPSERGVTDFSFCSHHALFHAVVLIIKDRASLYLWEVVECGKKRFVYYTYTAHKHTTY